MTLQKIYEEVLGEFVGCTMIPAVPVINFFLLVVKHEEEIERRADLLFNANSRLEGVAMAMSQRITELEAENVALRAQCEALSRVYEDNEKGVWTYIDKIKELESVTRAAMCVYCGESITYKQGEDISEIYKRIIKHDGECPKNPHLIRIAELKKMYKFEHDNRVEVGIENGTQAIKIAELESNVTELSVALKEACLQHISGNGTKPPANWIKSLKKVSNEITVH